jgi:hypothetical protein
MLALRRPKNGTPCWARRTRHDPSDPAGLREEDFTVPMTKLCRWLDVPRRTVYYKPIKSKPNVQDRFATPIKHMIEAKPSLGYQTVANLLHFNKNTVQRVFQLMGWQVRKRAFGHRPRIEALPSVATTTNERWATYLCRVWTGRDGWQTLALVIDCHTRELLGWQLSRSGRATTATAALEQALIARFGSLGRGDRLLSALGRTPSPLRLRGGRNTMLPSCIGYRDPALGDFLHDPKPLVDGTPSKASNARINLNSFYIRRRSRMARVTPSS